MAKKRNDSDSGKRLLVTEGTKALEPVKPLTDRAVEYFLLYTGTRPSYEWSKGDLIRLTSMSERQAEVEEITKRIYEEGLVVINHRGTQIANPLINVRDQLERTIMAAERSMSVYAPMQGGKKENIYNQAKEAEATADKKDDLLA